MHNFSIVILLLIMHNHCLFACMQTVPASSPSTGCNSCTLSQLSFTAANANANPQLGTVSASSITLNSNGCALITLSCTGTNAGLIQLNPPNVGAPTTCIQNPSVTCSATLVCDSSGEWTFTEGTLTTVITTASCEVF